MKLRNSHVIMDNILTFALYGQDWKIDFQAVMGAGPEDITIDLDCFGRVPVEEQEYAFVWMESCADLIVESFEVPPDIEMHRDLKDMLQEGFALQSS